MDIGRKVSITSELSLGRNKHSYNFIMNLPIALILTTEIIEIILQFISHPTHPIITTLKSDIKRLKTIPVLTSQVN